MLTLSLLFIVITLLVVGGAKVLIMELDERRERQNKNTGPNMNVISYRGKTYAEHKNEDMKKAAELGISIERYVSWKQRYDSWICEQTNLKPSTTPKEFYDIITYVYFITDNNGHVKIGKSNDPYKRLQALQTGNSNKLQIVLVLNDRSGDLEERLHKHFRKYRINGEWFILSDNILNFIQSYQGAKNELQRVRTNHHFFD